MVLVHARRPHREDVAVAVPLEVETANALPNRRLRILGKRRCLDLASDLFEDLASNVGGGRARHELVQAAPEAGHVEPVPVEVRGQTYRARHRQPDPLQLRQAHRLASAQRRVGRVDDVDQPAIRPRRDGGKHGAMLAAMRSRLYETLDSSDEGPMGPGSSRRYKRGLWRSPATRSRTIPSKRPLPRSAGRRSIWSARSRRSTCCPRSTSMRLPSPPTP